MTAPSPRRKLFLGCALMTAVACIALLVVPAGPASARSGSSATKVTSAVRQHDVIAPEWSNAAATRTASRLDADQSGPLRLAATTVWGWSQDQASPGKLDVWLVHYSTAAAQRLRSTYGANNIVVQTQSRAPVLTLGRLNDSPPYFGGDRILVPGAQCTSGPTVFGNAHNTPYMLTAGHCAAVGAQVKTPQGRVMGSVTNRRLCDYCIDGETVSGNYGRYVWDGPVITNSGLYEDYGRAPTAGSQLTVDGSFTGEVRFNTVTNANTTILACDASGACLHERYVFTIHNSGGHRACQPGDSGAPVYTHEGNTNKVIVNGILVAGNSSGTTCYGIRLDALENFFHVHIS